MRRCQAQNFAFSSISHAIELKASIWSSSSTKRSRMSQLRTLWKGKWKHVADCVHILWFMVYLMDDIVSARANLRKISQSHNWNNVSSAIFLQIKSGHIVNACSCKSHDLRTFLVVIWAVLQFAWETECDWSYSSDNHFVFPGRSNWQIIEIVIATYSINYFING